VSDDDELDPKSNDDDVDDDDELDVQSDDDDDEDVEEVQSFVELCASDRWPRRETTFTI
jgi:hypothetical protein